MPEKFRVRKITYASRPARRRDDPGDAPADAGRRRFSIRVIGLL
jgi:hypothetical protein